jgi:hypothetical protein
MGEPFVELYKGYLLRCEPHPTPEGTYLAGLVISLAERGGQNEVIPLDASGFSTKRAAAEHSLAVGKQLVDAKL